MLNCEYYSVLNTDKTIEEWWNNLNYVNKFDIGCIAIHFNLMSSNYKWNDYSNYEKLSKSQKKIIKNIFYSKNSEWSMFHFKYEQIGGGLKF